MERSVLTGQLRNIMTCCFSFVNSISNTCNLIFSLLKTTNRALMVLENPGKSWSFEKQTPGQEYLGMLIRPLKVLDFLSFSLTVLTTRQLLLSAKLLVGDFQSIFQLFVICFTVHFFVTCNALLLFWLHALLKSTESVCFSKLFTN